MHEVEQATYLLEKVIEKNSSVQLLIEAARPLEYTLMHEPKEFYADHLLKNLVRINAPRLRNKADLIRALHMLTW